jgi:hypothetical protein
MLALGWENASNPANDRKRPARTIKRPIKMCLLKKADRDADCFFMRDEVALFLAVSVVPPMGFY